MTVMIYVFLPFLPLSINDKVRSFVVYGQVLCLRMIDPPGQYVRPAREYVCGGEGFKGA